MSNLSEKLTATEQLLIIILFCLVSLFTMASADLLHTLYYSQSEGAIHQSSEWTHNHNDQACCTCCKAQGCTENCTCEDCIN